jgi:aromatic-L-amino-acid/L-tryptophan decarboxylase
MFFCRHVDAVQRAFDVSTSYMPAGQSQAVDQYRTTLQWSRRAIGLKVLMALAVQGHRGLAEQVDRQARMGDVLRAKLKGAGWTVVNDTALPLVCFTHERIRSSARDCSEVAKFIQDRGKAWISDVVLGGREKVLRACITSFKTDAADLDVLLAELAEGLAYQPTAAPSLR